MKKNKTFSSCLLTLDTQEQTKTYIETNINITWVIDDCNLFVGANTNKYTISRYINIFQVYNSRINFRD